MAKPRTIGNSIAPWRFLVFLIVLVVGAVPASLWLGSWSFGIIDAFDVAAMLFLLLCWRILTIDDPAEMERIAQLNDANRTFLLIITAIVMAVLLIALAAETTGHNPHVFEKGLIIVTLIVAWLFSNTVFALHYAHKAYVTPGFGCTGFRFPGTPEPVSFAFNIGVLAFTVNLLASGGA